MANNVTSACIEGKRKFFSFCLLLKPPTYSHLHLSTQQVTRENIGLYQFLILFFLFFFTFLLLFLLQTAVVVLQEIFFFFFCFRNKICCDDIEFVLNNNYCKRLTTTIFTESLSLFLLLFSSFSFLFFSFQFKFPTSPHKIFRYIQFAQMFCSLERLRVRIRKCD